MKARTLISYGLVSALSIVLAGPYSTVAAQATAAPIDIPPVDSRATAALLGQPTNRMGTPLRDGGTALADPFVTRAATRDLTAANVADFFDAAFHTQRLDHGIVGAVVSVVLDGEVLFQRGYGWADLEARVPADPERSLFRIASISKPFVWTAIMQLVEQGRVDLQADVNDYLDFTIPSTFDEPIRVWHLLSHTPGFEERWTGWRADSADDVRPLGEALADLMPARVWPPGEHAAYSNYGAALAGYIVERVSGQPWDAYVGEHILDPLGMTGTNASVPMRPELRERLARGYVYRGGRFEPTDYHYMHLTPAGVMSATASDMARFMIAHLNGGALGDERILREETAALMHSPLFVPHPDVLPILHGFYRSDRAGRVVFGHGGDTNQFHSQMALLPEVGLGVFVSYNSDPGAAARSRVVSALLDHFFEPGEHLRPAPEPADADLSAYEGEYLPLRGAFSNYERIRSAFGSAVKVGADGSELSFSGMELVAVGPDRFTGLYADVPIVFERDEAGAVTHVLVGSPLGTFRRVQGIEGSRVLILGWFMLLVAIGAVVVWVYRLLRPIPEERRLPSPHVRIALVHCVMLAALPLAFLALVPGTVDGVGWGLRGVALVWHLNLLFGAAVLVFAFRQWRRGSGRLLGRLGYTLVALASIANVALGWSLGVLGRLL